MLVNIRVGRSGASELKERMTFYSDDPLENPGDDRLGFRQFASNLADAILKTESEKGIVIGICGPWGTGKTTLRNFVVHFLEERSPKVIVIPFNAWWFSGREELLKALYSSLSRALIDQRFPKPVTDAAEKLGMAIGAIPMPIVRGKGKDVIAPVGHLLFGDFAEMNRQKKELSAQLSKEKRQIVFTIDDLDRLGTEELSQIFRVVTEIADLPFVTYLLTFDKDVVCAALKGKFSPSGEDYLEKVIQVPFQIPANDRDMYRSLFLNELDKLLTIVPNELINPHRLHEIYRQCIEQLISNPRRIFRLLNVLAVTLPPVAKDVDPIDFLCIEALRLYCPIVYEQVLKFPFYFTGGIASRLVDDEKRTFFFDNVLKGVPDLQHQAAESVLSFLFPDFAKSRGIKTGSRAARTSLQDSFGIHQEEKFPIYFQLSMPGWGVSTDEAIAILSLNDNPDDFDKAMHALKKQIRPDGSTRLGSFLERASELAETLEIDSAKRLLNYLINNGEDLLAVEDFAANRLAIPYGNEMPIERILLTILDRMDTTERKESVLQAISPSSSLGILCQLVYTIGRTHGKYQGEKTSSKQLVTLAELDSLEKRVVKLITEKVSNESLIDSKEQKLILMCWRYWDSDVPVRAWIEKVTATDEGLLKLLEHFFENSAIRSDSLSWHIGDLAALKERAANLLEKPLPASQEKAIKVFLDLDRPV